MSVFGKSVLFTGTMVTNENPAAAPAPSNRADRPAEIAYRNLRVRDVVQCFDGAWSTAVITRIADGQVYVERPYGVSDEISGALMVGIEKFSVYADSDRTFTVLSRPTND